LHCLQKQRILITVTSTEAAGAIIMTADPDSPSGEGMGVLSIEGEVSSIGSVVGSSGDGEEGVGKLDGEEGVGKLDGADTLGSVGEADGIDSVGEPGWMQNTLVTHISLIT
jgi:hypothetical protein